jgi:5-methyltetrahydrofolate--homocysteine methyltransferase
MMGVMPNQLTEVLSAEPVAPLAQGANCGVGAPDILVTVLEMQGAAVPIVSKGNCGVPQFVGTEIVYSGTPELMARYAALAVDAGASIVGGCCGTSPEHLAAMRQSIDSHTKGDRPTVEQIVEAVGPLTNSAPSANSGERRSRRSRGE